MVKFGISREGADALRQLSKDLKTSTDDIENHGKTLMSTISGLGEGLGIYEQSIVELVGKADAAQKAAEGSVEELMGKLTKMASNIDALVGQGLN